MRFVSGSADQVQAGWVDRAREVLAANDQKRADKARASGQGLAWVPTQADIEEENTALLAACTVGWSFSALDGVVFPCTPENARRFWTDGRFAAIREMALAFIWADGNFMQP